MRKKISLFGIIIVGLCVALLCYGLYAMTALTIIRHWGDKVSVPIVEVPSSCDKYNYIKVLHKGEIAEVSIGKVSCMNGEYRVGQTVTLFKHARFDDFVWPGSRPEIAFFIFITFLIVLFFSLRKKIRAGRNNKLREILK